MKIRVVVKKDTNTIAGFNIGTLEKCLQIIKTNKRNYEVSMRITKDIQFRKEPLSPDIVSKYAQIAKSILNTLARKGFKNGDSYLEPVDIYDHHYPHSVEGSRITLKNSKVLENEYTWECSIIPKSWDVVITATRTARHSEVLKLLQEEFNISEEDAEQLIKIIGQTLDDFHKNHVEIREHFIKIEHPPAKAYLSYNGKFAITLIAETTIEKASHYLKTYVRYGLRNVLVVPDTEYFKSNRISNISEFPIVLNKRTHSVPLPKTPYIFVIATDQLTEKKAKQILTNKLQLNRKLVNLALKHLKGEKVKIPLIYRCAINSYTYIS